MGVVRDLVAAKGRPLVMGILNVTPDSFYADSRAPDPGEAVARAARLVEAGADIVDVGGESTRPGAEPVSAEAEMDRVLPVVEALAGQLGVPVSVDTRRADVAEAVITRGATIVNDISAGRDDERMFDVVAKGGADVVLMHMQGTPPDMQRDPQYSDVVGEVAGFLIQRAGSAVWSGVERTSILLDPGIGFGKRLEHNLALLRATNTLSHLGYPLLVGASRKAMFEHLLGRPVEDRLPGSLAVAAWAAIHGASVLRVHDPRETADVVKVIRAIQEAS